MTDQASKLPPSDLDAEMAYLGGLAIAGTDRKLIAESLAGISRDSFLSPDNAEVFQSIKNLLDAGKPVDGLAIRAELAFRNKLEDVGGLPYLAKILNAVPHHKHTPHYAEILRKFAHRRKLIQVAEQSLARLNDPHTDVNETNQWMIEETATAQETSESTEIKTIGEVLDETFALVKSGGAPYLRTGIGDFDFRFGGIGRAKEMVVVGGRPSMGKSLVARQIVYGVAETEKIPALIVAVEENQQKIGENFFASKGEIDNESISMSRLEAKDYDSMEAVVKKYRNLPVYICDAANSLDDVCSVIAVGAAKHGCKLVMVDYLQLVTVRGRQMSREQEVATISRTLKTLAKRLGLCMLVAAQINRGTENRDDHRPRMSDLRESGQIEQDADRIFLLHREDYYHLGEENYSYDHEIEFIPAKNKNGSRGQGPLRVHAELKFQRFTEKRKIVSPI